jgi:DNA-binding CsgD family transcriptional regulator
LGGQRSSPRISGREALDRIAAGEAVAEVARTFGIDRATVYRLKP